MLRRGTRIKVLREQDLALQIIADLVGERRKASLRKLLVDAAPPDIAARFGLIDDKFIGCRTAGVRPRGDDERTIGREPAFTALKRQLDKGRSLEIGVNGRAPDKPVPASAARLPSARRVIKFIAAASDCRSLRSTKIEPNRSSLLLRCGTIGLSANAVQR